MENIITINVEDRDGTRQEVQVPTDVNLSLMEILKASEYDILATCGGMALCATCHVEVISGAENLTQAEDQELDMLDTLPDADDNSRLACQLRLTDMNNGLTIKIKGSLQ
ncbi:ferredoxin [Sphingobacterium mizutaii NBRC 14946 = DSM 11724]|uniref:Rhodocoxin n=2 Tax=Sphingobacterium mizutaii TaxID=1010 RepID=A0AAJ4XE36_9SPHI|nr:2Fe-2S iron-sulfur cluster-binding protein [Sphingobacterium mizutaii]GEM67215.1 ferredoxin [Sphingobacterium mizutaii NBRC 14946 = DSM 11724]SDL28605.1 ferredoxin, 2Fe-2S [Sphingobacterium mizutaii]SNV53828.1 Rhodocoxin [Sphingobacterium mizutaii]